MSTRTILRSVVALAAAVLLAAAPAQAKKLDEKGWSQAKAELEKALAATDVDAQVSAVAAIGADGSRRAADLLFATGTSDKLSSPRVYVAVLAALRAMVDGEARAYLVDNLEHKTDARLWPTRSLLCDALATEGGDDITKALIGRLKDGVPYVVSAAAKALGRRKDKKSVEPLIKLLGELEKKKDVTWLDARAALTAICGFDFETESEWSAFWASKKDTFDPTKDRGEKTEATLGSTVTRDEPKFFTEVIVSKRVMFVIDVSGSMKEEDIPVEEGGTGARTSSKKAARIEVAKNALIRCLKGLKADIRFNVIAFSDGCTTWRPSKQGLTPADEAAKADAIKWVSALQPDGATETDVALKEAFDNIDVNTIVLLSDGAPTRGRGGPGGPGGGGPGGPGGGGPGGRGRGGGGGEIDPQEILDKVALWNRLRGVKIHTFCFKVFEEMTQGGGGRGFRGMDPAKCLEFLKNLAEQNGGKLTKV